ncbi:hypothetical protein [uncultured Pseudokineococcus sp.]|uniref:hypothetical protein n=1 Tax=uncultured Pseudokineococcus sp. TaxID=1642928 RepID=UPI002613E6BB|nr:hypothetical protein [uncultured Pseudokineococcus sp.]
MSTRPARPPDHLPDPAGVLARPTTQPVSSSTLTARALRGARDERRLTDALALRAADRLERRALRATERAAGARRRAETAAALARA